VVIRSVHILRLIAVTISRARIAWQHWNVYLTVAMSK